MKSRAAAAQGTFAVAVTAAGVMCLSLIAAAALSFFSPAAWAAERFPPPEFTSHTLPTPETPSPPAALTEYIDLVVLFLCLVLATYLALRRRSRRGLLWLTVFSLAYFGFYRQGCICPVGSIQNVVLALSRSDYVIPLTVLGFFTLPILFAAFFGRTFCAAVCPLGAVQDLVLIKPVNVPKWLDRALGLLAYAYLGFAILLSALGSSFLICRYDPFVRIFRLTGGFGMIVFAVAFLVVGMVIGRPYCRYFCPYGVILGFVSRFSKWHVSIAPDSCITCRLCETSCPFGAIEEPATQRENPVKVKRRVAIALLLLPLWAGAFWWAGGRIAPIVARDHPTVLLAERIYLEEQGSVEGTTDASAAFRATGEPIESLYHRAAALQEAFKKGSSLVGLFLGIAAGLTFLGLCLPKRRDGFDTDRARCVSCGRCFAACPLEHKRLQELGRVR